MDVHPTKNVSIGIDPYPNHSRRADGYAAAQAHCFSAWEMVVGLPPPPKVKTGLQSIPAH